MEVRRRVTWASLVFGSTSISQYYHGRNGKMLDIDDNKKVVITWRVSTEQDNETLATYREGLESTQIRRLCLA